MQDHPVRQAPTTAPLRDLSDRTQVHDLVVGFYRELVLDDLLGPLFDEVAEVDWSLHIPKLIDFWCQVLLGQPGYDGYVLGAHQAVNRLERFRPEHFDRWYTLWAATVDARWVGPIAEVAKTHAAHTSRTLARRLTAVDWAPPGTSEPRGR